MQYIEAVLSIMETTEFFSVNNFKRTHFVFAFTNDVSFTKQFEYDAVVHVVAFVNGCTSVHAARWTTLFFMSRQNEYMPST